MGQTLSEPVVEKHTTTGEDERLAYGASAMQGWRITMEDAHTTILRLESGDDRHISFFAVFDGHGGPNVARYSGANLHNIVMRQPEFKKGNYNTALKKGFLETDVDLRNDPNFAREPSGCTAVSALITDDQIFVANAGDSRAVLSANGRAVPLSFDHKPVNPAETDRIVAAGGFVEFGRVNGNLALSRAIGDFEFKQSTDLAAERQIVTADPEIQERALEDTDEFVVIACDGIWDCKTNTDVINFVTNQILQKQDLGVIAEKLMDDCLAHDSDVGGVGCDNMTVVIVALLRGRTKEKWMADVAARVEQQGGLPTAVVVRRGDDLPAEGIN